MIPCVPDVLADAIKQVVHREGIKAMVLSKTLKVNKDCSSIQFRAGVTAHVVASMTSSWTLVMSERTA